MPAGSAAVIARKKQQKRREQLEKKAKAQEAQIDTLLEKFDHDHTGTLSRDEVKAMLTEVKREVTGDAASIVVDALLDKVLKATPDPNVLTRTEVLPAIKKYKAFLKHETGLNQLFERYDTDHDGQLSEDQLLGLLREIAPPPHKHADDADAAFVLSRCDADGSGGISRTELEPAMATWLEVAPTVVPLKDNGSAACSLL